MTRSWLIANFAADCLYHDMSGPLRGSRCTTAGFNYDASRVPFVGENETWPREGVTHQLKEPFAGTLARPRFH